MKNSLVFVGLIMVVVVIPNQLLIGQKLLAQPGNPYTLERQCKTPLHPINAPPEKQAAAAEALVTCDRALANTPKNSPILIDILANKAFALQILGRYEEAIAIWDRIIPIAPHRVGDRSLAVRELEKYSRWGSNRPIQIPDTWVKSLTEALRLTILKAKQPNYPVYTDWKLSPRELSLFSRLCTKKVVLPEQLVANPALTRSIMECVVRLIFNDEYYQTRNNELQAVRLTAAMFRFGTTNSEVMNWPREAEFLQIVVNNYRQLRSSSKR